MIDYSPIIIIASAYVDMMKDEDYCIKDYTPIHPPNLEIELDGIRDILEIKATYTQSTSR